MQYKCKVTVIDKKCFPDYQKEYLADPQSGVCPFYEIGDEFIFERYGGEDTFWLAGDGTQCGSLGLHQPVYLHCSAGRQHYARMDKRRADDDRMLQRRYPPGYF